MLLRYWDYRGGITLPSSYTSDYGVARGALTQTLYHIGLSLQHKDATWAASIADTINEFCDGLSLPKKASWAFGGFLLSEEIKNNHNPCIIFAALPESKGHAIVAYGYNTYENSFPTFVCHYGWEGYSNVHVSASISGTTYGSNLKYNPY